MTNEHSQRRVAHRPARRSRKSVAGAVARRRRRAGGVAVGSGAITGFPTIWAQNIKNITLRQFGTGMSDLKRSPTRCKEDLGLHLAA